MAISFKFYSDSNLTSEIAGLDQLTHYTDLSDNDQDGLIYWGSIDSDRTLQEYTAPGSGQITISVQDILPQWAASTAYISGDMVQPLASPDGYRYECTTAGTSGGSEPTWDTTEGNTTTDNTAVWTNRGAKHEETEVYLALTSGGLDTATAGASLNVGTSISGGVGNAVTIYYRVRNAVTSVGSNAGYPALALQHNKVLES